VDLQEPAVQAHVEFLVETGETPLAHVAERSDVVGEHRYRQYGLSFPGHRRQTSSFTIWRIYLFEALRRGKVSGRRGGVLLNSAHPCAIRNVNRTTEMREHNPVDGGGDVPV
jgi:hypothetical protein